uniref:Uncharacterized protein n=1 Tax=Ananas comosus var. bracteatus TaxID=296719 RepID=A0A6V7Q2D1_ANACO|nr:unnamed protein product [Ananas comosus var. bracteatus]
MLFGVHNPSRPRPPLSSSSSSFPSSASTTPVTVPRLVDLLEKHLRVRALRRVVDMPSNGDVPFTHADVPFTHADVARACADVRLSQGTATSVSVVGRYLLSYALALHRRAAHERPENPETTWVRTNSMVPSGYGHPREKLDR